MIATHVALSDVTPHRGTVRAFGSYDDCADHVRQNGDDTWWIVSYAENWPTPEEGIIGLRVWLPLP